MYVDYSSKFASFERPKCIERQDWLDYVMIRGWLRGRKNPKCFSRDLNGLFLTGEELAVYQAGFLRGKHGNALDQPLPA